MKGVCDRRVRCAALGLILTAGAMVRAEEPRVVGTELSRQSVVGSPHDLSVSGPGPVQALEEEQVCVFCHAPHRASGQRPLWNRHMPPTHYRIYDSSTTDARIDQPSGSSKMCLSCHDGALALGLLSSRPPLDPALMSHRTMPPGPSDLSKDLSDDHPIGFRYDRALSGRDPQLRPPDMVTPLLPMGPHREMQCTTCHDPHDNQLGDFLRMPTRRSAMCTACHDMNGWEHSSHATSNALVSGRAVDRTERLDFQTVCDNGCLSCHAIHSADQPERLLRFRRDEQNCLNCHNGSVARTNIAGEVRKPSGHRVERYAGRHDAAEDPRTMRYHVTCVDCHNPHASNTVDVVREETPSLGLVSGSMQWVSGVDRMGRPVERARQEYEVCFKCHGDRLTGTPRPQISRQVYSNSLRLQFQTGNPSYHPVVGPRNNQDVVSLLPPWRVGSMMRCTDCHNSDRQASLPGDKRSGPHGSIHEPLLIERYETRDFTTESPQSYALCYRCHDRQSILGDESFPLHSRHVVQGRAPCSACHDPHGVSRWQAAGRNHGSLINFDRQIVQPASGGLGSRIEYEDLGVYRGSCTLTCHGVAHVRLQYEK